MDELQRHIGRIVNTGSTVVVVMPEIKGKEDHALVVETDSLPPKYGDTFGDIMNTEAQRTPDLIGLLGRRRFGTNEIMINALHANGYLKAMPQERIAMLVTKHSAMPLKDIILEMRKLRGDAIDPTIEPQDLRPLAEQLAPPPIEEETKKVTSEELDNLVDDLVSHSETNVGKTMPMPVESSTEALEAAVAELTKVVTILTNKLGETDKPKKRGRPKKDAK